MDERGGGIGEREIKMWFRGGGYLERQRNTYVADKVVRDIERRR